MPYISQEERRKFEEVLSNIPEIKKKGELEFCVYWLMKRYMVGKEWRYSVLHDCTYAAMHCADEFRRRHLDHREDDAIAQNGDIDPKPTP